jgi:hypothetical protein
MGSVRLDSRRLSHARTRGATCPRKAWLGGSPAVLERKQEFNKVVAASSGLPSVFAGVILGVTWSAFFGVFASPFLAVISSPFLAVISSPFLAVISSEARNLGPKTKISQSRSLPWFAASLLSK